MCVDFRRLDSQVFMDLRKPPRIEVELRKLESVKYNRIFFLL